MKRRTKKFYIFIILIICLISVLVFLYLHKSSNNQFQGYAYTKYQIQNTKYSLLIADTPAKQEKGLMYVRKRDGFDGMLFLFSQKDYLTFWNKNTLVDLDLYWLDGDKVVGKSFLPSIEKSKTIITVSSPNLANKVIELIR